MVRSSIGSASFWGGLALLAVSSTASAQWMPFSGNNCGGCNTRPSLFGPPPVAFQSASASCCSASMPMQRTAMVSESVQCGQPIACTIEQPVQMRQMVQAVRVEPLQPVVHPVYDTVQVTEYRPVKQRVSKPIYETEYVDQNVTVMQSVTQQRTVNVPTVDYQNVTEYKKVQKQVGYWVTKNEATGKISPCQYDNRPTMLGAMNRAGYQVRTAFTPQSKTTRQFVPQTMTCTVPCTKKVAVQGMKQVTYNVTSMVPTQTTRKVAVSKMRHVEEEITVMKPITVAKTMQVGTRISYAPVGSGAGGGTGVATGLQPTADPKASAKNPDGTPKRTAEGGIDGFPPGLAPDDFNNRNGGVPIRKSSYPTPIEQDAVDRGHLTETTVPARQAAPTAPVQPTFNAPSIVRVSQWVARTPLPASPSTGKLGAMSLAGNVP